MATILGAVASSAAATSQPAVSMAAAVAADAAPAVTAAGVAAATAAAAAVPWWVEWWPYGAGLPHAAVIDRVFAHTLPLSAFGVEFAHTWHGHVAQLLASTLGGLLLFPLVAYFIGRYIPALVGTGGGRDGGGVGGGKVGGGITRGGSSVGGTKGKSVGAGAGGSPADGSLRWLQVSLLVPAQLAFLLVPTRVPDDLPFFPLVRLILFMNVIAYSLKAWEFVLGNYTERNVTATANFPRFAFVYCLLNDAVWPSSPEDAHRGRVAGIVRIVRGARELVTSWLLIGVMALAPAIGHFNFSALLFVGNYTFFAFSGVVDFLEGLIGLITGAQCQDIFVFPLLATDPRDFWSRRWNLFFKGWAHRNIFLRFGGGKRAWLTAPLVFLFSALMHEYMVLCILGETHGEMLAFFVGQGILTQVYTLLRAAIPARFALPRPLAVIVHTCVFTVSSILFHLPIHKVLPTFAIAAKVRETLGLSNYAIGRVAELLLPSFIDHLE